MNEEAVRVEAAPLEENTQRVGKRLLLRTAKYQRGRWSPRGIEERLTAQLVGDEGLRASLLRFIDVFPALRSDREIALHLSDYLAEAEKLQRGSKPLRIATGLAGKARNSAIAGWIAAGFSRATIHRIARRFIVESDMGSIARHLSRLELEGFLFTLDVLGEAVHSEKEARRFLDTYLDLGGNLEKQLGSRRSNASDGTGPRVNLSIKLSSLTPHFDPMDPEGTARAIGEKLRTLFRVARGAGSFVNVDVETRAVRELTRFAVTKVLEEEEFRDWADVGVVVQTYLRDGEAESDAWLEWVKKRGTEITIRLVKGAYWDSEQVWAQQKGWPVPVHLSKTATDAAYERCLDRLIAAHGVVRTAVGSHNARSIARAIALAELHRVPRGRLEIQMLHGMAEPLRRAVRDEGIPVRVYVPTGQLVPGMAYLVRRLLENTSQNSFVRQMNIEQRAIPSLLAPPFENRKAAKGGGR